MNRILYHYCRPLAILLFFFVAIAGSGLEAHAMNPAPERDIYAIRIYNLTTKEQEDALDKYLRGALLPALHRDGIAEVGVFKPIGNDTAAMRRIYVLMPFHSLEQFNQLTQKLQKDERYQEDGKDWLAVRYDSLPFARMETILLEAFPDAPHLQVPTAIKSSPASERIYELRSYEGPTEEYFANKVKMFNAGGEIGLFRKLGFNGVFYAAVIAGAHMPNLMYMTSFENMAAREAHWKTFSADPFWKQLSGSPEYQHNVSHIDIVFLHPTAYSDL